MPQATYSNGVDTAAAAASNLSALQRINSYLNNTLDLRSLAALAAQPPITAASANNAGSIDSLWSDLVSGGGADCSQRMQPARPKAHSVGGTVSSNGGVSSLQLSQLLNGAAGRYSPRTSQGYGTSANGSGGGGSNNNVFSYQLPVQQSKEDTTSSGGSGASPPSMGGGSSIASPTHFPYAASPSRLNTRLSNISEPGSPSLDEAIMMGIERQRQQQQEAAAAAAQEKLTDLTLADLMGSLNLSTNSSGRLNTTGLNSSCGGVGLGQYSSNGGVPNLSSSSLNTTSLANFSHLPQGLDLSQLAQLQNNNNNNSSSNSSGSVAWRSGRMSSDQGYSSGSLSNSYNGSGQQAYHNGSMACPLLGGGGLTPSSSTLDMLASLERGAPLSSFLPAQDPYCIEKAAKMHRTAAAVCEATCTWSGQLPIRMHKNPFYSCKVFLGGVPWDVTEVALRQTFLHFGNIMVEWPGKENSANPPKGYVYILFDNEKQVKNLLAACSQDFSNGGNYYFKISSRRMRQKEVQVIPWVMSDSNYVRCPSYQLDAHKTVFIGALHGMLSAEALANIINDLFGGVVYAGIDTDKHKYPIGSGRITFNNLQSYRKAVRAAFVEIKTPKFTKKVQIDPYLADSLCQMCGMQQGPYFCRDETCFKYFCRTCWLVVPHHQNSSGCHKPLMRNSKLRTQTRLTGLV